MSLSSAATLNPHDMPRSVVNRISVEKASKGGGSRNIGHVFHIFSVALRFAIYHQFNARSTLNPDSHVGQPLSLMASYDSLLFQDDDVIFRKTSTCCSLLTKHSGIKGFYSLSLIICPRIFPSHGTQERRTMTVKRIIPNVKTEQVSVAKSFYGDIPGMAIAMDQGWIVTFAISNNILLPRHPRSVSPAKAIRNTHPRSFH